MQIRYVEPVDRGVTSLMYVGDDAPVVGDARDSHLLFGGIAAVVAMYSKGKVRLAALGVLGYAVYKEMK